LEVLEKPFESERFTLLIQVEHVVVGQLLRGELEVVAGGHQN
jgi:hypothetical protein